MKSRFLSLLALCLVFFTNVSRAVDPMTPEAMESLKARLKVMKETLNTHLSTRNSSAGQTFMTASADPRAAVELYLNCTKMVEYDRAGRPESDFRAWEDSQKARVTDPKFIESLQQQLKYLALSCQAAETAERAEIFGPLMAFVDGLSYLKEMPTGNLTQSVAGSVFARAYYLENLLGKSQDWESVPMNISGIYSRTILPYLRKEKPDALMNAWDKRIEQETRLVMMLEEKKQEELRGLGREEERRARNAQSGQGGVLKDHSKDEFTARTLPQLQWGKLKDMFLHVDQMNAAKAMVTFVEANLTHELGETFYAEFESLIETAQTSASAAAAAAAAPAPAPGNSGN